METFILLLNLSNTCRPCLHRQRCTNGEKCAGIACKSAAQDQNRHNLSNVQLWELKHRLDGKQVSLVVAEGKGQIDKNHQFCQHRRGPLFVVGNALYRDPLWCPHHKVTPLCVGHCHSTLHLKKVVVLLLQLKCFIRHKRTGKILSHCAFSKLACVLHRKRAFNL